MTTPTRIIVDLAAGTTTEVELEGAELDAYNVSLAEQEAAFEGAQVQPSLVVSAVFSTAGLAINVTSTGVSDNTPVECLVSDESGHTQQLAGVLVGGVTALNGVDTKLFMTQTLHVLVAARASTGLLNATTSLVLPTPAPTNTDPEVRLTQFFFARGQVVVNVETSNVEEGATVIVAINDAAGNGVSYEGVIDVNGAFNVSEPAPALSGTVEATVLVFSAQGDLQIYGTTEV